MQLRARPRLTCSLRMNGLFSCMWQSLLRDTLTLVKLSEGLTDLRTFEATKASLEANLNAFVT
jgi:hypothetical protein